MKQKFLFAEGCHGLAVRKYALSSLSINLCSSLGSLQRLKKVLWTINQDFDLEPLLWDNCWTVPFVRKPLRN